MLCMEQVVRLGQATAVSLLARSLKVKSTDREDSTGQTQATTRVTLRMESSMAREYITFQINKRLTMELLSKESFKERAKKFGAMAKSTLETS